MGFPFDEIHGSTSGPSMTCTSSFTALLELPPPRAAELLFKEDFLAKNLPPPIFPCTVGLIHRASKFSILTSVDNPPESNIIPSVSNSMKPDVVKQELLDLDTDPNSSCPAASDHCLKSGKRKVMECKVKESNIKSKIISKEPSGSGDGEKLSYVHVRARRGQATASHSLADRAMREKINARMKLLQELVPGCNKISGTAMVLDEIINHIQALQQEVEFLSMKLAAVDPQIDFNDASVSTMGGSSNNNGCTGMSAPSICTEGPINGTTQQLRYQQLGHRDEFHHQCPEQRRRRKP